jgi:hypothetical protein
MWYPILKKGGWIAGHDYRDSSDVYRAVNKYFKGFAKQDGACWVQQKKD